MPFDDTPVSPSSEDSPINASTADTSLLRFPTSNYNEIGNWITITRKKYSKEDIDSEEKLVDADGARVIALPIPSDLNKSYTAGWDTENVGTWTNFIRGAATEGINKFRNALPANNPNGYSAGGIAKSLADTVTGLDAADLKSFGWNAAMAYGSSILTNLDIFKDTSAFTGMTRNPYKVALFGSPSFRTFRFGWKMFPKNYQEAVAIRDIISQLQVGMSPDFDAIFKNNIYTYPDLFLLKITNDSHLFQFKPTVMTNLAVSYHNEGYPVYITGPNGEKVPASMSLDLELMEVAILTRQDFAKEGANF
jgi:hypothetical protein